MKKIFTWFSSNYDPTKSVTNQKWSEKFDGGEEDATFSSEQINNPTRENPRGLDLAQRIEMMMKEIETLDNSLPDLNLIKVKPSI